jgi:hypothetical protein
LRSRKEAYAVSRIVKKIEPIDELRNRVILFRRGTAYRNMLKK